LAKETTRVRYRFIRRVVLIVAVFSVAVYLGCATPKPCTVTPVDIEEIRSDIRDLDTKLTESKAILAKLQDGVAIVQAQLEEKRTEVPVLQAEFDRLKKASGVSVTPPAEMQPAADSTAGMLGGAQ